MNKLVNKWFLPLFFLMIVATSFRLMAQDEKTEKAEANFCESVNGFLSSLKDLESANLRMDIPNFTDAYKKVDKAWNKLVKSAKKLEKIDSKEATKAYNELAETLEEVVNYNIKTSVNTEKITKQIAKSRDTINQLNTAICE